MMIDRDKVARAICVADCGRVTENELDRCADLADAAIAAVLEQLREPLLELASDLEAEVRDRWGDDIRLAHKVDRDIASAVAVRAFLQPPDSSNPAE